MFPFRSARRRKKANRTLLSKILVWMFGPLFLLWTIGIVITYFIAQNIANAPYDRTLPDHLRLLKHEVEQQHHARGEKPRPNAKFTGFGRSATDKQGVFSFDTVKPGMVPGPGGKPQAPHIVVCIFSRGMLRQIYTRLYFSDEAGNSADPILQMVPEDRRGTLIAHKQPGSGAAVYRFDIRVQGDNETVFFDI